MVLKELSNDIMLELVDKRIAELTLFLRGEFGYESKDKEHILDDLAGDCYKYVFLNGYLDLKLTFFFRMKYKEFPTVFHVYLENKKIGRLSLDDFLKKHKKENTVHLFTLDPSNQTFEVFVDDFFNFIRELFQGFFKDYLTGVKFEDTPFNWMGMK